MPGNLLPTSLPSPSKNRRESVSGPPSIHTQLSRHPTLALPPNSLALRHDPPRGLHRTRSGSLSLIRPANLIDVHPYVVAHFTHTVSAYGGADVFWRCSNSDAIY